MRNSVRPLDANDNSQQPYRLTSHRVQPQVARCMRATADSTGQFGVKELNAAMAHPNARSSCFLGPTGSPELLSVRHFIRKDIGRRVDSIPGVWCFAGLQGRRFCSRCRSITSPVALMTAEVTHPVARWRSVHLKPSCPAHQHHNLCCRHRRRPLIPQGQTYSSTRC